MRSSCRRPGTHHRVKIGCAIAVLNHTGWRGSRKPRLADQSGFDAYLDPFALFPVRFSTVRPASAAIPPLAEHQAGAGRGPHDGLYVKTRSRRARRSPMRSRPDAVSLETRVPEPTQDRRSTSHAGTVAFHRQGVVPGAVFRKWPQTPYHDRTPSACKRQACRERCLQVQERPQSTTRILCALHIAP